MYKNMFIFQFNGWLPVEKIHTSVRKNKDVRVELIPSRLGEFFMAGETAHQVYVAFRGAERVISYKKNDAWVPLPDSISISKRA